MNATLAPLATTVPSLGGKAYAMNTITANNTMLAYAIRLMATSYADALCGTYTGSNSKETLRSTLDTLCEEAKRRGMMNEINPILDEIFA